MMKPIPVSYTHLKDNPQLYSQLAAYIRGKQKEGDGE